jgi:uncharacterized cupin superfamily protein
MPGPDLPIHIDDVPRQRWDYGEIGATRRKLGAACDARRLGVALVEVDPGKRAAPPHSHGDEDEAFLVLAGSGLSYQVSTDGDARTYEIGTDDLLWHSAGGDAHTLIAADAGLTVFVVSEGSRSNITYLPRTGQFWLGPLWAPSDSAHPFEADAELGPLDLPDPTPSGRPPFATSPSSPSRRDARDGSRMPPGACAPRGSCWPRTRCRRTRTTRSCTSIPRARRRGT